MPAFLVSPLARWLGAGALVLALLAGVYFTGRSHEAAKWKPRIAEVRAELKDCQANRAKLDAAIKVQNAEVDRLKREGDARIKAADEAYAKAEKGRANAEAVARKLLTRPVTGNVCADLLAVDRALLESIR